MPTIRHRKKDKIFYHFFKKPIDKLPKVWYNKVYPKERKRGNTTMNKIKMICFDMDGTIANLYGVQGWLEMIENENPKPYEIAEPMWDMVELATTLKMLQVKGYEIRVITWLAKDSTEEYKTLTRQAKLEWLEKYGFPYNKFHGIAYGTTKANCIRQYLDINEQAILIDDNDKIRQGWNWGETINPTTENIIDILKALL
jgi:hypothetical protein